MALVNTLADFAHSTDHLASIVPGRQHSRVAVAPRPPFFRWREQWCVGIDALDRDRRALVAILNHMALRFGESPDGAPPPGAADLAMARRHADAPSALCYWLDALRTRTRDHFAREESLMRATHYPELAEHAGEHALMLAEYTALMRDIVARGDEQLRLADLEALKQWFMGHVLDMDKRLGRYLRGNGISTLWPRH